MLSQVIDPRELAKQQKAAAKLAARKEKAAAVDVKSLTGTALARLDPNVLAHLSVAQVKALTLTQLEGMSAEQLAAFTPEQIASLSKDMQDYMTSSQRTRRLCRARRRATRVPQHR